MVVIPEATSIDERLDETFESLKIPLKERKKLNKQMKSALIIPNINLRNKLYEFIVPVNLLVDHIEAKDFYAKKVFIHGKFSHLFEPSAFRAQKYISINNALVIVHTLWKRRYLIENGKMIKDLIEEVGTKRGASYLSGVYKKLNDQGLLKLKFLPPPRNNGLIDFSKCSYRFFPNDYPKVLEYEIDKKKKEEECIRPVKLANILGVSSSVVERSIQKYVDLGIISDVKLWNFGKTNSKRLIHKNDIVFFEEEGMINDAFKFAMMDPEERRNFIQSSNENGSNFSKKFEKWKMLKFPVTFFHNILDEKKLYMVDYTFNDMFKEYMEQIVTRGHNYISFQNSLLVVNKLWERKHLIEHGKTINDLIEEAGIKESYEAVLKRYRALNEEGVIILKMYPTPNEKGTIDRQHSSYKFIDEDYNEWLEFEKRRITTRETYLSATDVANELNIPYHKSLNLFLGKEGILDIVRLTNHSKTYFEWFIHPDHVNYLTEDILPELGHSIEDLINIKDKIHSTEIVGKDVYNKMGHDDGYIKYVFDMISGFRNKGIGSNNTLIKNLFFTDDKLYESTILKIAIASVEKIEINTMVNKYVNLAIHLSQS